MCFHFPSRAKRGAERKNSGFFRWQMLENRIFLRVADSRLSYQSRVDGVAFWLALAIVTIIAQLGDDKTLLNIT